MLLLSAAARDTELLRAWAEGHELLREAAASLASDTELLERLARDPSRRVRRAVAASPHAAALRQRMAGSDGAAEVRARAVSASDRQHERQAPFASALRTMRDGGMLATDVRRALLTAEPLLDEEGAFLAARHFSEEDLCT